MAQSIPAIMESSQPSRGSGTATVEDNGLTVLYNPASPKLDIVFVHGFNGHPERTWTCEAEAPSSSRTSHEDDRAGTTPFRLRRVLSGSQRAGRTQPSLAETKVYWPRDLVPQTAPDARVAVFGYDTRIHHRLGPPRTQNTVYDHAKELLHSITDIRVQPSECTRPILFIAHSLGGIVVKEALRQSKCFVGHKVNGTLATVFESTVGIFFFGTPHGGADPRTFLVHIAELAVRAAGFTVNRTVCETLLPDAERLRQLRNEFPLLVDERKWTIVSFRETLGMQALGGKKVVEENSACLGTPNLETVRDIESDHREMCRFRSLQDSRYQKVSAPLRRLIQELDTALVSNTDAPSPSLVRSESQTTQVTTNKISQLLTHDEFEKAKRLLHFNQMDARLMSLKSAQEKTCTWLLKSRQYREWLAPASLRDHGGFFWIKGSPGTGKSISMKYLVQKAPTANRAVTMSFFFHARGESLERSTEGLYRSLLLQLLEKVPETRTALSPSLRGRLDTIEHCGWPLEFLKDTFAQGVLSKHRCPIYCYVDALDECPETDVRDMIMFFEDLGHKEMSAEFRVCFSSRHYPEISIRTGIVLVLEKEEEHSVDIQTYIDKHLLLPDTPKADDIKSEIVRKSAGIFLWVALVVPILNKAHDSGRVDALAERLGEIPIGLHDLFMDILTRDSKNPKQLLVCLQLVLFSKRPLKADEFYVALRTGSDNKAQGTLDRTSVTLVVMRRLVIDASKGLAEITGGSLQRVQFIHESVRDFLRGDGGLANFPLWSKTTEGSGHETLRRICWLHHLHRGGRVNRQEPFTDYSAKNLIYHANEAQRLGIDQSQFLKQIEDSLQPRGTMSTYLKSIVLDISGGWLRQPPGSSVLFFLVSERANNLVLIHPLRPQYLSLKFPQGETVFEYALGKLSHKEARAVAGISDLEATDDVVEVQPTHRGGVLDMDMMVLLVKRGDTFLLHKVVEDSSYQAGFMEGQHLLMLARSESMVNALVAVASSLSIFPTAGALKVVLPLQLDRIAPMSHNGVSHLRHLVDNHESIVRSPIWRGQSLLSFAAGHEFYGIIDLFFDSSSSKVFSYEEHLVELFLELVEGAHRHVPVNEERRLRLVRYLHTRRPDLASRVGKSGQTPIHALLCQPGNERVLSVLLPDTSGQLKNAKNRDGVNALTAALFTPLRESERLSLHSYQFRREIPDHWIEIPGRVSVRDWSEEWSKWTKQLLRVGTDAMSETRWSIFSLTRNSSLENLTVYEPLWIECRQKYVDLLLDAGWDISLPLQSNHGLLSLSMCGDMEWLVGIVGIRDEEITSALRRLARIAYATDPRAIQIRRQTGYWDSISFLLRSRLDVYNTTGYFPVASGEHNWGAIRAAILARRPILVDLASRAIYENPGFKHLPTYKYSLYESISLAIYMFEDDSCSFDILRLLLLALRAWDLAAPALVGDFCKYAPFRLNHLTPGAYAEEKGLEAVGRLMEGLSFGQPGSLGAPFRASMHDFDNL